MRETEIAHGSTFGKVIVTTSYSLILISQEFREITDEICHRLHILTVERLEINLNSRHGRLFTIQRSCIVRKTFQRCLGKVLKVRIEVSERAIVELVVRIDLIHAVQSAVEKSRDRLHAFSIFVGFSCLGVVRIEVHTTLHLLRLVDAGAEHASESLSRPKIRYLLRKSWLPRSYSFHSVRTVRIEVFNVILPSCFVTRGNDFARCVSYCVSWNG